MRLEQTFTVKAPVEKVMNAMRDPELIAADAATRDTKKTEVKDIECTDQRHVFEIHSDDYVRGLKGVDKSKTEHNVATNTWDLVNQRNSWVWKGGGDMSAMANITGGSNLQGQDGSTTLTMYVEIDIPVPVIGKKIAKKVAAGFEKAWPEYMARLEKWANK